MHYHHAPTNKKHKACTQYPDAGLWSRTDLIRWTEFFTFRNRKNDTASAAGEKGRNFGVFLTHKKKNHAEDEYSPRLKIVKLTNSSEERRVNYFNVIILGH